MNIGVPAAGGEVSVGEHVEWLAILPHAWEEYVRPPTADVNLTFAMSFFVIILVHITGCRPRRGNCSICSSACSRH